MTTNKTLYFIKIRQSQFRELVPSLSVDYLRNTIKVLNTEISSFSHKIDKCNLPSFDLKERRSRDIRVFKEKIEDRIKEIGREIKELAIPEKIVTEKIQQYFVSILKRLLILYRNIEQKSLERPETIQDNAVPTVYGQDTEECMTQDTIYRNAAIRSSMFNLSSTIIQLKMVLKTQTSMIDTIDFYFDRANVYLEEANKEIDKIPGKYTGFKDMIIYGLLYVICALLCLVLVKVYKNRFKL